MKLSGWGFRSFTLLSAAFVALAGIHAYRFGFSNFTTQYNLTLLSLNYADFGAIRRGLAGSLIHVTRLDLRTGALLLYAVANLVFIGVVAWIIARRRWRNIVDVAPFVLVPVAFLTLWAEDPGRTDPLIAALIALAALAARTGRLLPASALLSIGLFAHEVSYIFGLPLLAATVLARPQLRSLRSLDGILAAALLVCSCALYAAFSRLPHAAAGQIVDTARAQVGHSADLPLLYNLQGGRGLRDAMCQNSLDPNFFVNGLTGPIMIACCTFSLAGRSTKVWAQCLIAALPPFLFLWFIALDNARWITLALVNVWLICALTDQKESGALDRDVYSRLGLAAILLLLNSPLLYRTEQALYSTSPVIDRIVSGLRDAYTLKAGASLRLCDPNWEGTLGGVGAAQR